MSRKRRTLLGSSNLAIIPIEVRGPSDIEPAFSKIRDNQVDGLVVCQDGLFFSKRKEIAELALAQHLPAAVYSRETVAAGALASYGPDNYGIFRRTGYYVDKILKGAKPSELPVEQPTKFEFIINRNTAKALNLTIPQAILLPRTTCSNRHNLLRCLCLELAHRVI